MDDIMPAQPLINRFTILKLLDELAHLGVSNTEVDVLVVRLGPVDLDLLQECKHAHPAFGSENIRVLQRR